LILTAVFVVLYINFNSKKIDIDTDFEKALSERPNYARPVVFRIESCMRQKLKEAFIILGERGGEIYSNIDPPTKGDFVNSQGVNYLGNTIPYWEYVITPTGRTSGFQVKTHLPALCKGGRTQSPCLTSAPVGQDELSIEGQLERYVDENIKPCFDDFRLELEQGFEIIEEGEFKSEVTIRESSGDVLIRAHYPLKITKDETVSTVDSYQYNLNLDFAFLYKKMFDFRKSPQRVRRGDQAGGA